MNKKNILNRRRFLTGSSAVLGASLMPTIASSALGQSSRSGSQGATINSDQNVHKVPVLTGKEFDLLLFLASNKGRVFTKKQLYTQVWTEEYDFDDNNLMAFISKLRKKIEPNPEQPFYIQTVRGVGYRFNKEA